MDRYHEYQKKAGNFNMDANSVKSVKDAMPGFRAAHKAKKAEIDAENKKTGAALKSFWVNSGKSSLVLAHNGVILMIWACLMAVIAYAALQFAFVLVAFVLAETGGIMMETPVDVITTYVVIAMCCGFDMFFSFAIEKYLIKCMSRRFWKLDYAKGQIDKGALWHEKHPDADGD